MRTSLIITLAFVTFASGACDKKDPSASQPTATAPAKPAAAQPAAHAHSGHEGQAHADVKPGSHEDWCVEHGVPESMCTRCNVSLKPAFKATGDWCVEHDLPESQCLKCNPDLKFERPPKTAGK